MKTLILLAFAFSLSCTQEDAAGDNNGSWTFNNKTNNKTNNGTGSSNNGTTSNNSGTSANNGTTSGTNNGTTSGTNNGTTSGTNNGTTSGTNNGTTTAVRVPKSHRPVAIACDDVRPPGGGGIENSVCLVDADCTEGVNGRCNSGRKGGYCSYDNCFADSDCGANACICEGSGTSTVGNQCLRGDCQVDSDCGAGGFCSPTFGSCGNYSGNVAYFCHTPEDECIDDSDCGGSDTKPGFGKPYCKFSPEVSRWVCDDAHCVG